jgi:hypothetical protein
VSLNRREFMWACGGTVAALSWGAAPAGPGMEGKTWMIPELSREFFEKLVGETFWVAPEAGKEAALKLAKVVDTTPRAPEGRPCPVRTESFSAMFAGAPEMPLQQGIHTFRHPAVGETALFLVPVVSATPEVRRYEVVVNRLVKA